MRCYATTAAFAIAIALGLWIHADSAAAQDAAAVMAKLKVSFPTKVVDHKGKIVGTYEPINQTFGPYGILDTVLVVINGTAHQMLVGDPFLSGVGISGFTNTCQNVRLFRFSAINCSGQSLTQVQNGIGGQPLAFDELSGASGCVQDDTLYYAQAPYAADPYLSYGTGSDPDHISNCTNASGAAWSGATATFDLTKLRLTPPFKLK